MCHIQGPGAAADGTPRLALRAGTLSGSLPGPPPPLHGVPPWQPVVHPRDVLLVHQVGLDNRHSPGRRRDGLRGCLRRVRDLLRFLRHFLDGRWAPSDLIILYITGSCCVTGTQNMTCPTAHSQTQRQVEGYNRTIVAQLQTFVADHQRPATSWCPSSCWRTRRVPRRAAR